MKHQMSSFHAAASHIHKRISAFEASCSRKEERSLDEWSTLQQSWGQICQLGNAQRKFHAKTTQTELEAEIVCPGISKSSRQEYRAFGIGSETEKLRHADKTVNQKALQSAWTVRCSRHDWTNNVPADKHIAGNWSKCFDAVIFWIAKHFISLFANCFLRRCTETASTDVTIIPH